MRETPRSVPLCCSVQMTVRTFLTGFLPVLFSIGVLSECGHVLAVSESEANGPVPVAPLAVRVDPNRTSRFQAEVAISGTLTTPTAAGDQSWNLSSEVRFVFLQRQFPSEFGGPGMLKAIRRYETAQAAIQVGKQHRTRTQLPSGLAVIHVRGGIDRMEAAAAGGLLSQREHDLLMMPFDPLPCTGLLPQRDVGTGDKWNGDSWLLPRLTGIDAVTEQSLTCELRSQNGREAIIVFRGTAEGAVSGSAVSTTVSGELTFSKTDRCIERLECRLKEKRSAGPVSPGIDAIITVRWTQTPDASGQVPEQTDDSLFDRPFRLSTPWRLVLQHGRDWHEFNRTDQMMMLRQIRNGSLIAQCNISSGVAVAPGQHTSDADFRSDVLREIGPLQGRIISEATVRDDDRWRVRHIRVQGTVKDVRIFRDYYLCTAGSGDQFSLMFSHTAADAEAFGDEPQKWIRALQLRPVRPALPFR